MSIFKKKNKNPQQKELPSSLEEGELTIDAYETKNDFVIVSTIAGVNSKNLDISIEDDMLIIKGKREKPKNTDKDRTYFQKECFWGNFSKRIILPEKVKISKAEADIEDGILTLKIPKAKTSPSTKIKIEDK